VTRKRINGRAILIVIEPITAANLFAFKDVRLRALQDSPSAFSSTYARESEFTDSDWIERINNWNGERGIGFLAIDKRVESVKSDESVGNIACGIAGGLLDPEPPASSNVPQPKLVSMWTAPTHRRSGVGELLVNQVIAWARQRGARELKLMVTSRNEPAIRFYEKLGFTRTGRTEPYPNDATMSEYEMARTIA
jgi:ribosomal protein S18 acetylase RimI-like enzyme